MVVCGRLGASTDALICTRGLQAPATGQLARFCRVQGVMLIDSGATTMNTTHESQAGVKAICAHPEATCSTAHHTAVHSQLTDRHAHACCSICS